MKTYIALLRGINVSGHKIIKMETLRNVLAELHFSNIRTYIQSGNILFESDKNDIDQLQDQIRLLIKSHFTFDVPVIIVTVEDLKSIVVNNPYKITDDATQPYVAFLSKAPTNEAITVLKSIDFNNDEFTHSDKALYLWYANTAGTTKLSNTMIESKLKVGATTRNWKTINKLISLAENQD